MPKSDPDAELEIAITDYKDASAKLSDTSRSIGFGLTGVFFSVAFAESAILTSFMNHNKIALICVGVLGCSTILFDYFHYLFGYLASVEAGISQGNFNVRGWRYRAHSAFFWWKQILAGLGTVILIYALFNELVTIA